MPLHDWTRVGAWAFHDFQIAWVAAISRALNGGLLPEEYYVLAESVSGARTSHEPLPDDGAARFVSPLLVIRHTRGDRIVAMIEIVSSGNKASEYAWQTVIDKSLAALRRGIHLLILDLYPPTARDPDGFHGSLWYQLDGATYQHPADADRTLAAYSAGYVKTAYVEPVAVGQALREMPLFLTADGIGYIEVPLEATYQAAYAGVPKRYRAVLETAG